MADLRLIRAVRRISTVLARIERQLAAHDGVSVSQLRILMRLVQEEERGMRVSELAEDQGLAISTMTRNLALLEKRRWLTRSSGSNDKRTVVVTLTEEGRRHANALEARSNAVFQRAFQPFHRSAALERAVALQRVASALEEVSLPERSSVAATQEAVPAHAKRR